MSQLESNTRSAYDTAAELVGDLAKLGAAWLHYGLTLGQTSLVTSARSLEDAARSLQKLSQKLER